MSGVSIRTLHFYDEIGLLKPAFLGENRYRYYEEEQLLILQQILFYRELDFSLEDIQRILQSDDFNKLNALESHKKILLECLDKKKQLIQTIDKTILHLRGQVNMKNEELYYGFDSEVQKKHEKSLVDKGIVTQEFLDGCNAKVKDWSDKEKNHFINEMGKIYQALIQAVENKVDPSSDHVQQLMDLHYKWLELTWTPNKESYLGLRQLYQTPEFRKFFDSLHPKLLEFVIAAMEVYARNKL